jgi:hypothetical protein
VDPCALVIGLVVLAAGACGKKGPPQPPLVRLPAAPADLIADRRGSIVDLRLAVPSQNTDGSRPANVERVEVYAWSGPPGATAADVLRRGTRVGAVAVKAPRDPNRTVAAGDPLSDVEPPEGEGLDQGAVARFRDRLEASPAGGGGAPESAEPSEPPVRSYVAVALSTRGRRGPASSIAAVTLGPAPPPPGTPELSYDEAGVTVVWNPAAEASDGGVREPSADAPALVYHVYEVFEPEPAPPDPDARDPDAPAGPPAERLTTKPVAETTFLDQRVAWDEERCYVVRSVRVAGLTVESEATPKACVTAVDTFPPAPPTGLTAVASEGAVSLIWNPCTERDLAGYHVWRRPGGAGEFSRVTEAPIAETTYTDQVAAGGRYEYAVQAVDRAGNASGRSDPVEETARGR